MQCPACLSTMVCHCSCGDSSCELVLCHRCDYEGHWLEFEYPPVEEVIVGKYSAKLPDEDRDYHPSRSTEERFPLDQDLRKHGFLIRGRPNGGPAIWVLGGDRYGRGGVEFTEAEAVLRLLNDEVAA